MVHNYKWIWLALLCAFCSGCPRKSPAPPPPGSAADIAQLAVLRNLGLAYLENEDLEKSRSTFSTLVELQPEELMCARNLGVSWTLAVTGVDRGQSGQLEFVQTGFLKAIASLKQLDSSEVPLLLAAQGHVSLQETTAAMTDLQEAVKTNPDNATAWFQLFTVAGLSSNPTEQAIGRNALKQAYRLQPQNLVILLDWLLAQAETEDPAIIETLTNSEKLLEQLAPGLEKRVRIDIRDFIKGAKDAAAEGDWPVVMRNVRILKNVIQPDDAAQSDRKRIEKHPLEYMLEEFSPRIEEQITAAQARDISNVDVDFKVIKIETDADLDVLDATFADIDLNQTVDLCLLQTGKLSVLSTGADWNELAETNVPVGQTHLVIADLENDADEALVPAEQKDKVCHTADLELITYGSAGLTLFQSKLSQIGGEIALTPFDLQGELADFREIQKVLISDVNNDGDLDLIVLAEEGLSLWSNRGNLLFERFAPTWELPESVIDLIAVDYDHDVDTDVVTLLKSGKLGYLENLRHGTFRWQALDIAPNTIQPELLGLTDFDRDGEWDLMVAGGTHGVILTPAKAPKQTEINPSIDGTGEPVQFLDWDYDNDGFRDLVYLTSDSLSIQRGDGTSKQGRGWVMRDLGIGDKLLGADVGDFDADGDDDLLVVGNERLMLYVNEGGNQNHWIDVELLAQQLTRDGTTASGRVNQYGIGSVIEVRTGVGYQKQLVTKQKTRFGIGSHDKADAIRVLWTNGVPANVLEPVANQLICERQSLKGSCPYLYTWNGEEFVFVTDLLWASPIGLQNAQGELVPARNWENLKVPGKMLAEKNGAYQLQITEELWEVAYFDHCQLIAIDHPADVEIFSNEKVGPPRISEFKIHTVQNKRHPISVVNQSGEDLSSFVAQQDELYAKPFDDKLRQGYTSDSWLEIDLGLKEKPQNLKLYLTGWIYPTDTSINAALHENPDLPGPSPPSLSVPNAAGEFVEVVPFTGFPGGKTKTIVLELNDVFLAEDYRVRLSTSSELYWDEIFFTIGEGESGIEVVQTSLPLTSAELHYRGVSTRVAHPQFGPEYYDYNQIDPLPAWPAIDGSFTRYGDVLPLISNADDRLVIMGTGDEMTLKFSIPDLPLPAGWKRDFILHNVGWDKDADLHTVYGSAVEPLPFRTMSGYPYAVDQDFPTDIDSYNVHTRRMNPVRYRHSMRRSFGSN